MSADGEDVGSGIASLVHIVDDEPGGGDRAKNIEADSASRASSPTGNGTVAAIRPVP